MPAVVTPDPDGRPQVEADATRRVNELADGWIGGVPWVKPKLPAQTVCKNIADDEGNFQPSLSSGCTSAFHGCGSCGATLAALKRVRRKDSMAPNSNADQLMGILQQTVIGLVADDRLDLTVRQLAVFLTCYLSGGSHTVRGLAAELNVTRPIISRCLDRLTDLELAVRRPDPEDRRSILVGRTAEGVAFVRELGAIMTRAAKAGERGYAV